MTQVIHGPFAQFHDGRRVGCKMNAKDVLSCHAQRKKGLAVGTIDHLDHESEQWREAVVEDDQTPIPEQAAFRIDFPQWLALHNQKARIRSFIRTGDVEESAPLWLGSAAYQP